MKQMITERREAYSQILEILKRMDPALANKIPEEIVKTFEEYKMDEYEFYYDENLTLNEQNINRITRTLLAYLNLNFWCETEEEKQELVEIYSKNSELYEQILQVEFDPKKVFEKENKEEKEIEDKTEMIEYKESAIKKIFNKIFNIFKNKNK